VGSAIARCNIDIVLIHVLLHSAAQGSLLLYIPLQQPVQQCQDTGHCLSKFLVKVNPSETVHCGLFGLSLPVDAQHHHAPQRGFFFTCHCTSNLRDNNLSWSDSLREVVPCQIGGAHACRVVVSAESGVENHFPLL